MKELKIYLSFTIIFIFISNMIYSQSSCVFSATYFKNDNKLPPLKTGKGFDITDIYRQTNFCFTKESSNKNNLVRQQNGQKSTITMYYTKDDNEYNALKNLGVSGKISYLNLFSLGGTKLMEFSSETSIQTERLIFVANVDFGNFEYENDLILTSEAKSYIDNNKFNDFISMYGTHYITGIKKEASIWIIISKYSTKNITSNSNKIDFGATILNYGFGGGMENPNETKVQDFLKNENLTVSVEINGPSLKKNDLENSIRSIINSSTTKDKLNGISEIIKGAIGELSDQEQGLITQYYFAPFSLKGLKNIFWDLKKENQLIKINENVLKVFTAKNNVDNLTESNSLNNILTDYDNIFSTNFTGKLKFRTELQFTYNQILPSLILYKKELSLIYSNLEESYKKCSDIKCDPNVNCCEFTDTEKKIKTIIPKIESTISKLNKVYENAFASALAEASSPNCQKNNTGILNIVNKSINPYLIYKNGNLLMTIRGKCEEKIEVELGITVFKAEQKTGYMLYPTVNTRKVEFTKACQESTIKIGYEE